MPHFSINSALEKLDSALDLVANSLTPRSAQYFQPQFYPAPSTSNAFTIQNQNWTCSKCTQLNTQSGKRCVWCDSEKDIGKILNRNHRSKFLRYYFIILDLLKFEMWFAPALNAAKFTMSTLQNKIKLAKTPIIQKHGRKKNIQNHKKLLKF